MFLGKSSGNVKFILHFLSQVASFLTVGIISLPSVSLKTSFLEPDFLLFCKKRKKKPPSILFVAEFSKKCENNPRGCGNYPRKQ